MKILKFIVVIILVSIVHCSFGNPANNITTCDQYPARIRVDYMELQKLPNGEAITICPRQSVEIGNFTRFTDVAKVIKIVRTNEGDSPLTVEIAGSLIICNSSVNSCQQTSENTKNWYPLLDTLQMMVNSYPAVLNIKTGYGQAYLVMSNYTAGESNIINVVLTAGKYAK